MSKSLRSEAGKFMGKVVYRPGPGAMLTDLRELVERREAERVRLAKERLLNPPQPPADAPKLDNTAYELHMRSKEWRKFRAAILRMRGRKCEKCGTRDKQLELHHKTYDRLGRELASDVKILCVDCHDKRHPNHPRRRYNKGRG